VAPSSATAGELRSFLAQFLFTGDDVYKHVRDLSGGEKGRLALAKLIYSRVNVLVLDEPTNHLDIPSREALEEALSAYEGTIVTISHDRYFLDKVATQILALDGEGHAEHYEGDYTEYHDWKASSVGKENFPKVSHPANLVETVIPAERSEPPKIEEVKTQSRTTRGKSKAATGQTKPSVKVIKKKKLELRTPEMIESDIAAAETRLEKISEQMGLPEVARDPQQLVKLDEEYREVESRLKVLYEEWETAATQKTG
jgi:ATP-binding cassette subfamily F protein 3